MYKGNIILLVLCLLGIVTGTAIYFEASAYQKKAKVIEGIVDYRLGSNYRVKYTSDDGVDHTFSGSQKNNRHREGEKVKIFYRIDNPDKARISDGKKGGKNIIIIAIVMLLFDLYLIYTNRKKIRVSDKFKTTGRKVKGEITSVEIDNTITIQNRHPYIVNCKWVDPMTGKEYTHTIKNIWKDPAQQLAGSNTIDVYIDREEPEKYFLDLEFLTDLNPAAYTDSVVDNTN